MSPVLKRYCISVGVGLFLFVLVIVNHGLFEAESTKDQIRILADAFTIPGTVILMFGFLMMVSNTGVFSGLGYAMKNIARIVIPGVGLRKQGTYYDYLKDKREKREKNQVSFGFLFITGAAFLLIAVVLVVIYYNMK